MRNTILYIFLINALIISALNSDKCKYLTSEKYNNSLDNIVKCAYIDVDDGYFTSPDNGCKYDNKLNKLGNGLIYLIPIKPFDLSEMSDSSISKEVIRINNLTILEIKKNFNIYIALIEKEYLIKDMKAESLYYPSYPYVLKLIYYDKTFKSWCLVKEYKIQTINDEQNSYQDIRNFVSNRSKGSLW